MPNNLKIDLINSAYGELLISGITVGATPGDNEIALSQLENLAAELFGKNNDVGYFFEDDPDLNTPHNVERMYWYSVSILLAFRLVNVFQKQMPPALPGQVRAAYSFIANTTDITRPIQPPRTAPIGSGNLIGTGLNQWYKFYRPASETPLSAKSIRMAVDDVNDFVEHFDAYLREGEDIDSYVLTADTGLTVVSQSMTTEDVLYQIKAVGSSSESSSGVFQVKIVVTTTNSRVETRIIHFSIIDTDVINN